MKKFVLIFLLAVLTISLYSCSKNKSIDKTSWSYQEQDGKLVLKFITKTDMSLTKTSDDEELAFAGTYTYDAPNVTLNIMGDAIKGVDGSKLTLTNPDDGSIIVFNKE